MIMFMAMFVVLFFPVNLGMYVCIQYDVCVCVCVHACISVIKLGGNGQGERPIPDHTSVAPKFTVTVIPTAIATSSRSSRRTVSQRG